MFNKINIFRVCSDSLQFKKKTINFWLAHLNLTPTALTPHSMLGKPKTYNVHLRRLTI
jgi:hypothetical protein